MRLRQRGSRRHVNWAQQQQQHQQQRAATYTFTYHEGQAEIRGNAVSANFIRRGSVNPQGAVDYTTRDDYQCARFQTYTLTHNISH